MRKTRAIKAFSTAAAIAAVSAGVVVGTAGSGAATAGTGSATAGNGVAAAAPGLQAFGISSDGTLMATFTTDNPKVLNWVRTVMGLSGDTSLIGIDFRVQNGLMYGVGNFGGIYTITTPPWGATSGDVVVTKVSQLGVALYGTTFDIDFNPAADRLRVISDNGQNLRHNLADHTTIEDTILTTPPSTAPAKGVTAAAYTNNDLNADTATTLFDLNTITDQTVIQSPANNGFLAPTGALGVDAGLNAGFDIFSDLTNGKTTSVTGFATLVPSGGSATLYTVNLLNGAVAPVGQFPLPITDIAVALDTN